MGPDESPKTLYLVDGTAQLFRAYFAIRGLTNPEGLPTNAVYGFTTMLRKLLRDEAPAYIGVAFDVKGPVFRHEAYAEYKANRPAAPEDLHVQVPYAKRVCEVLGIPALELAGYEADDLIATYTVQARQAGFDVVVVAADKDLLQLVGQGVTLLNPSKNVVLDEDGVEQSFGVPPDRVRDVLGLMGDSVDNVPGVPGVGRKSALAIVSTYGEMEAVIERARRFVAVYDGRDRLLESMDAAAREAALQEAAASLVGQSAAELSKAIARLLEVEKDPAMRERISTVAQTLDASGAAELTSEVGKPGKRAIKSLAALKRELKGLDRGSSKRTWYAIVEHEEQARLSKRLVTLHEEVPVEFAPQAFNRTPFERQPASELFQSLGFTTLLGDFEQDEVPGKLEPTKAAVECRPVLDAKQLDEVVACCREAGRVAIAVATDGASPLQAKLVGLALAYAEGRADYVPLGHEYLGAPEQLDLDTVRDTLGPLLADAGLPKVGHFLKHQAHTLGRHGLPLRGWGLETTVAAFLLDSNRTGYALDRLVQEFLGDPIGTAPPGKPAAASEIEVETFAAEAGKKVEATWRLAGALQDRLNSAELDGLYDTMDGPLLPLLLDMEARGILIDTDLLGRMSKEMETALERAQSEIHALAGGEFNVDSPKQLREVLFEKLGLKSRRRTAKGREASTDAQTLEELVSKHPIAESILQYRELSKLKNTYVDSLPRLVHPETGRVHTSYHPTGAATGRISSSDPNLQNIPVRTEAGRKIRAAFVPQDGCVFLASDYSQIELRILAHFTEDPELVGAFQAGEDIHRHTASKVFDVPPDLVTDQMRRRAKAVNFGILYGMSEMRLAREQGMTRADAGRFIQAYFERFARVRDYIDEIRERVTREGEVRTLFGRVRRFPQLQGQVNRAVREQALRAAVNTPLQGTAADLMKLAMLAVSGELERQGLAARILLQVHDELLLEVPAGEAETVAQLVRRAMEDVHPLAVPLVVDQKTGENWLEVT